MTKSFLLVTMSLLIVLSTKSQTISMSEFIVNSTIKIESTEQKIVTGQVRHYISTGTGFFFTFSTQYGSVTAIVTNKHVIKDAEEGTLYFKISDSANDVSNYHVEKVAINKFESEWISHPDSSVDLVILPIGNIINYYAQKGKKLLFAPYSEKEIPSDVVKKTLSAIEDVLMIGYPFGLRDLKNDLPIVRKGLTATPFYLNYNQTPEFLIDMAVYPGSSGSPVIIYNNGIIMPKTGGAQAGFRILLLGINYATYTNGFEGKIIPKASYNIEDSLAVSTPIPYNIGIIIKSERILDFKSVLEARMKH